MLSTDGIYKEEVLFDQMLFTGAGPVGGAGPGGGAGLATGAGPGGGGGLDTGLTGIP